MFIALAAAGLMLASAAPAEAGTRIVSPTMGAFKARPSAKVLVRTSSHVSSFTAWLETRNITGSFTNKGRTHVARLNGLRPGVNHIYVSTKSARGKEDFEFVRFVVARRRSAGLLAMPPLGVGGAQAPVKAQVSRPSDAKLRARLNGEGVSSAFLHRKGNTYLARLGADEGLRYGTNRFRVVAYHDSGRFDVESQRFRLSRKRPIASAGPSRTTRVGTRVRLNGQASRLASHRGERSFRWSVVGSPGGATLKRAHTARPILQAGEPGTYEVGVQVRHRGTSAESTDTTVVDVLPDDPPIGARLETFANANGLITIGGEPVARTGAGGNTLSYVLLSRSNRIPPIPSSSCRSSVPFAGNVPFDAAGIQTLEQLVGDCSDPKYMLILNGAHGVERHSLGEFNSLLAMIGGDPLTDFEKGPVSHCPISVIGIPDAPPGSAFTNFNRDYGSCGPSDLSGYLQMSTATKQYGFVFSDFPPYDTQTAHTSNSNTMTVGGKTYTKSLPPGADAGFHAVVVDPRTLAVRFAGNLTYVTNGDPHDVHQGLVYLEDTLLRDVVEDRGLVFIQSIGNPSPTDPAWSRVAAAIEKVGGSRSVFNQLDGTGGYAFVGGPGAGTAAIEASEPLTKEPGRLAGVLSLSRSAVFEPTISDPEASVVQDLLPTVYQPPQPFEPFKGGAQAANAYFTKLVFGKSAQPLDLRAHYWLDWGQEWGKIRDQVHDATYAQASGECACLPAEFTATQTKLVSEIDDLRDVKNWVQAMQATVDPSQQVFNLSQISFKIQDAVKPPDTQASGDAGGIFIAILSVGATLLGEPESSVATIAASVMGAFAGGQSAADGSELLGEIQAKTSDLGSRISTRFVLAKSALTGLGQIVVSDAGKLSKVAEKVRTDPHWKFNDPTPISTTIGKGVKRWFYAELMSAAWARWELPGVGNARDWYCYGHDPYTATRPWSNAPDSAQYQAVTGFDSDMRPSTVVRALGIRDIDAFRDHGAPNGGARSPPASLTDPLFKPANLQPDSDQLGLFKQQFYEEELEPRGPVGFQSRC